MEFLLPHIFHHQQKHHRMFLKHFALLSRACSHQRLCLPNAVSATALSTSTVSTSRLLWTLSCAAAAELDSSSEATLAMMEVKEVEGVEVILAGVVEVALRKVTVVGVEREGGDCPGGGAAGV